MRVISLYLAERFDLTKLESILKQRKENKWKRHWNAIELLDEDGSKVIFFFPNGTVVSWNIRPHKLAPYIELVRDAAINPTSKDIRDEFVAFYSEETSLFPHGYFNVDMLSLESDDPFIKLALSHGLSQSIKLNYHEICLEGLIQRYQPLIMEITANNFRLPRNRINRILGDILIRRSELNLASNFSYQPKFFWQNPGTEMYYIQVESYLDIPKRAQTLNNQLDTLNETFMMFNSYLENEHSHFLEIVIIVLISFELIFNIVNAHWF